MSDREAAILVVDENRTSAENLKELIEFMDTPGVITAAPGDWQSRLGSRRLSAMFVGPDLSDADIEALLDGLGAFDANVPVVMLRSGS